MRTIRFSDLGVWRSPWTKTPINRDPPRRSMGPDSQTGSDIILRPPVDRMTDTCKNITLPPNFFVGSKNLTQGDAHPLHLLPLIRHCICISTLVFFTSKIYQAIFLRNLNVSYSLGLDSSSCRRKGMTKIINKIGEAFEKLRS